MLRRSTAVLAAMAALVAGCARDTTSPTTPHRSQAAAAIDEAFAAEDDARGQGEADAGPGSDAATGGRASGHAEFVVGGVKSKYTFVALTTVAPAAKGRFELHRWFPDGSMLVMTGEVICMTLLPTPLGPRARMAGRVESLRVDNDERVVPPELDRAMWTVQDGGEGADATLDFASGLFNFRSDAVAQSHCRIGSPITLFGTPDNSIQVNLP